ncbi:MAG TPA: membrane dipeptidase, partial [Actinopolymorphaceae bacterium]|nr:membrane dipeptidase [Actinopolymorphaceae bacterium]
SSARAVCDVPRNVPDDVLAALPANGGVCMVTFVPQFVSPACAKWQAEAADAAREAGVNPTDLGAFYAFTDSWQAPRPKPLATIADVVAHIEHVREVAGIDHVGIGGDYDGVDTLPEGLEDVSGYPRVFAALLDRSWSEADLVKLAGANAIRVLRAAESVAADLSQRRGPSLATVEALDGDTNGG